MLLRYAIRIFLVLWLCLTILELSAQADENKVSKSAQGPFILKEKENSFSANLPFDRPLHFIYEGDSTNPVTYIGLYELNRMGCIIPGYMERCNVRKLKIQRKYSIDSVVIEIKKQSLKDLTKQVREPNCVRCLFKLGLIFRKNKSNIPRIREFQKKYRKLIKTARSETTAQDLYSNFSNDAANIYFDVPPLRASRNYRLYITKRNHGSQLDSMLHYLHKNDTISAKRIFNNIQNTYYNNDCYLCQCHEADHGIFAKLIKHYAEYVHEINSLLISSKDKLDTLNNINAIKLGRIKLYQSETVKNGLLDFYKFINRSDKIEAEDDISMWPDIDSNISAINYFLTSSARLNSDSISRGVQALNNQMPLGNKSNFSRVLANLTQSRNLVWPLLQYYNYYCLQKTPTCDTFDPAENYLSDIYKGFSNNLEIIQRHNSRVELLTLQVKQLKSKHDSLIWQFPYFIHQAESNDINSTYAFNTTTKNSLDLDIGFIVYSNFKSNSLLGGSPTLGLHLALSPLDREVSFKFRREKRLLDRISINAGLLLNDFNEKGKRSGLIGQYAAYTGLGYARTPWLRFQSGIVWYKALHENPLKDQSALAVAPYFGFNLDLDITNILASLGDLIGL